MFDLYELFCLTFLQDRKPCLDITVINVTTLEFYITKFKKYPHSISLRPIS